MTVADDALRLIDIFNEGDTDPNAPDDATDWAREDALIARARAAGLHVVVAFSDFRNWWVMRQEVLHDPQVPGDDWVSACQTYALGVVQFAALDPYSVAARPAWTAFMTYVANWVNTVSGMPYCNDPTILVVSIAGEPWGAGSNECGEATTQQELTDFYTWALGEWKSLDANHLRSNGGLTGTYFGLDGNGDPIPSGQQIDGVSIFALADNTLPSLHTYPPTGTLADGQTPVMGAEAQRLGKPWFTEEFGWTQGVGDATRATNYQWLYGEQATYGSAGSLLWNLGPRPIPARSIRTRRRPSPGRSSWITRPGRDPSRRLVAAPHPYRDEYERRADEADDHGEDLEPVRPGHACAGDRGRVRWRQ